MRLGGIELGLGGGGRHQATARGRAGCLLTDSDDDDWHYSDVMGAPIPRQAVSGEDAIRGHS